MTELLISWLQVGAGTRAEVCPDHIEQPVFERNDGGVVDLVLLERANLTIAHPQQFILDQPVRTDEQCVPGEGRQGLIRRVAVTGGTERQRLPPALAGFVKAV